MIEITAYRTNLGLFLKNPKRYYESMSNIKINGHPLPETAAHTDWILLKDVQDITSYETMQKGAQKLVGFTLKIASVANDEIPLNLSLDDVQQYYDDDEEETCWKNYSDLQALYKPVYEQTADEWMVQEFKLNVLRELQIDSYDKPVEMKVSMLEEGGWSKRTGTYDLSAIVRYSDIERMLTPEFLMHERPCSLTSEQVYKIVRDYIRTHIDGKYARITSDYDFCFTVKRLVAIKPYNVQKSVKKTSRSRPKLVTQTVSYKEVDLFEMTSAKDAYKGYTVIQGWQANNLKEMSEQVSSYLAELMEEINRPVQECPTCSGTGCVDAGKIETNKR